MPALLSVLVLSLSLAAGGCGSAPSNANGNGQGQSGASATPAKNMTIKIGSKQFTEQMILGQILAQLLEANGYKVKTYFGLGGTNIAHQALVSGKIDLYPEYTGTGLVDILKDPPQNDPAKVYETVKKAYQEKWNLDWLKPYGFDNTYAIAVSKKEAEKGITTISDLAKQKNVRMAMYPEFEGREDGYKGLQKVYGLNIAPANIKHLETAVAYQAINSGSIDATVCFSTDGLLKKYNLTVLKDNKNFFPPYYAATVVRADLLKKDPHIKSVLNELAGKLPNDVMMDLNYQVDVQQKSPEVVAKGFLKSAGLVK